MNPIAVRILESLDNPKKLESLFRQDPRSFRESFDEACRSMQDSVTVKVWKARLDYENQTHQAMQLDGRRLGVAIAIALCVGALVRLPALWLGEEWYYPRLAPSWIILGVAAYFWLLQPHRGRLIAGMVMTVTIACYAIFLPSRLDPESGLHYGDSVVMALVHLPILFWGFLGIVFSGPTWRTPESRIHYVRFNGEMLVLSSLVGLGGMVFSMITIALFELVFENPAERYFQNVGVVGVAGLPLVATYLYDVVFKRKTGIASVLGRVFAPLFLLMNVIFLSVAFVGGKNPLMDRSFLIVVNGLLLVVLGMTVFSIADRGKDNEVGWMDYINVALLLVTLAIDLVALSAILFRLTSYGFSPNRVVVVGVNLVVMTHLARTCQAYIGLIKKKNGTDFVGKAVTDYLPVYVYWSAFVVFILPFVFQFS